MAQHTSKIKFRGVEYIETVGFIPHGLEDGLIAWRRQGHKPQVIDYYDPTKPESVESARQRIRDFLSSLSPDDRTKADPEGYGYNPTDPTNKPTGTMPDLDGPGAM